MILSIPVGCIFCLTAIMCFISFIKLAFCSRAIRKQRLQEFIGGFISMILSATVFVGLQAIYAYAPASIADIRLDIRHFLGFLVAVIVVRFIVERITDGIKKLKERKRYE
ncbi:hypothetical protein [Ohessyouella blattaphilus]